jgi:hypothetical protein
VDTVEIKAFVPVEDFELSKRFYRELGFTMAWTTKDLAYFHSSISSFLLQDFYRLDHAQNVMMHMLVIDVAAWWARVVDQQVAVRYGVPIRRKTGPGIFVISL